MFGYISPCSGLRMSCLWTYQHLVSWCSDFLYVACKRFCFLLFVQSTPYGWQLHIGLGVHITESGSSPAFNKQSDLGYSSLPFSAIIPIYRTFLEWGKYWTLISFPRLRSFICNLCHVSIILKWLRKILKNEISTRLSTHICCEPRLRLFEGRRVIQSILVSSPLLCCLQGIVVYGSFYLHGPPGTETGEAGVSRKDLCYGCFIDTDWLSICLCWKSPSADLGPWVLSHSWLIRDS